MWFFDHVAHVKNDPCGAVSVHGLCGALGVLSVGIFADGTYGAGWNGVSGNVKGILYGDGGTALVAQIAHVFLGFVWAFGVTWVVFTIAKRFMSLRPPAEAEIEGLDVPEFGALCYPDFVLTTSRASTAWSTQTDSTTTAGSAAQGAVSR